eukprot:246380-Chlamydomonas_euryale.AAC.1
MPHPTNNQPPLRSKPHVNPSLESPTRQAHRAAPQHQPPPLLLAHARHAPAVVSPGPLDGCRRLLLAVKQAQQVGKPGCAMADLAWRLKSSASEASASKALASKASASQASASKALASQASASQASASSASANPNTRFMKSGDGWRKREWQSNRGAKQLPDLIQAAARYQDSSCQAAAR